MVLNGLNLAHSTKFGASCLIQRLLPLDQAAGALFLLSSRSAQSMQIGRTARLGSVQPLDDPTAAPSWRESGQRSSRPLATVTKAEQPGRCTGLVREQDKACAAAWLLALCSRCEQLVRRRAVHTRSKQGLEATSKPFPLITA